MSRIQRYFKSSKKNTGTCIQKNKDTSFARITDRYRYLRDNQRSIIQRGGDFQGTKKKNEVPGRAQTCAVLISLPEARLQGDCLVVLSLPMLQTKSFGEFPNQNKKKKLFSRSQLYFKSGPETGRGKGLNVVNPIRCRVKRDTVPTLPSPWFIKAT